MPAIESPNGGQIRRSPGETGDIRTSPRSDNESMARILRTTLVALLASLALAGTAQAAGGDYVIELRSPEAQATVRAALDASRFNFDRIPAQITIRISHCGCAGAREGIIVLDESVVLDTSLGARYSWGLIQHEYAHQIDYFLFQDDDRAAVRRTLGGKDWCYEVGGLAHDEHGCERFADVFSWAFWPTQDNVLRADAKAIAPGMTAKAARRFVNRLLAA
jgi:hypothetical protein